MQCHCWLSYNNTVRSVLLSPIIVITHVASVWGSCSPRICLSGATSAAVSSQCCRLCTNVDCMYRHCTQCTHVLYCTVHRIICRLQFLRDCPHGYMYKTLKIQILISISIFTSSYDNVLSVLLQCWTISNWYLVIVLLWIDYVLRFQAQTMFLELSLGIDIWFLIRDSWNVIWRERDNWN